MPLCQGTNPDFIPHGLAPSDPGLTDLLKVPVGYELLRTPNHDAMHNEVVARSACRDKPGHKKWSPFILKSVESGKTGPFESNGPRQG
jgi:hypothetical protein